MIQRLAACVIVFLTSGSVLAGQLDDAGRATRQPGASSPSHSDDDDDEEVDCDAACAEFMARLLLAPFSVPRELVESERQLELWYDDYPYARGSGYVGLRYAPLGNGPETHEITTGPDPRRGQRWAVQTFLEGGANLDGVGRGALRARLLMPVPVELEFESMGFLEADQGGHDWAMLSAGRLNWRFAEASQVQFRTAIGVQHWVEDAESGAETPLTAEQRSRLGFDFAYGFDAFVQAPFVLGMEGRVGALGQALIWQARATLGAMLGPVEWYAGYHEVNIGGVSLGGPVTGLRGFF